MVGCPHRGLENPAGARFCNSCGAALAAALAGTTYGGGYETGGRANLALAEVHLAEGDAEARLALARALRACGDTAAAARQAGGALDLSRAKGHVTGAEAAEAFLRSISVAPG